MLLLFAAAVELSVKNNCGYTVWLATTPNSNKAPLPGGSVRLQADQSHTYQVGA